jgi:tetratricopeptide (TPR) repeat protein
MGQLLDLVLWDRSPLVVGYSGWDGDVFMAALKRRLYKERRLPFNLYWFCFQRTEMERLPGWLTDHENTRFVIPPEAPTEGACTPTSALGSERPPAVTFGSSGSLTDKPTLKASWVFQEFIRKLDVPAPQLVDEPLEFFSGFLERNLPDDNDEGIGPFLIRNVFERIQEGARLERKAREARTPQELALGQISDAVRRFSYREAVEISERLDLALLTSSQRDSLENALHELYVSIPDSEPSIGLTACEIRARLAELSPEDARLDSSWSLRVAETMNGIGYYLSLLDRHEEAIAAFGRVIESSGTFNDLRLREKVVSALINRALVLGSIGRTESQIESLDELVERFGESTESSLKEAIGRALIIKAGVLGKTRGSEAVRVVCDELIDRFADSSERDTVASALVNEAYSIDEKAWCEQEEKPRCNLYQNAITMYKSAISLSPENPIALKNLAADLLRLGREQHDSIIIDEALAASLRAAEIGGGRYNLACALALTGKGDAALGELSLCLERGEISRDEVAADPDWNDFHSNPRFKALSLLDT